MPMPVAYSPARASCPALGRLLLSAHPPASFPPPRLRNARTARLPSKQRAGERANEQKMKGRRLMVKKGSSIRIDYACDFRARLDTMGVF